VYSSFDGDPTGMLDGRVVAMTRVAQVAADEQVLLRILRLSNVRYVVGIEDQRFSFLKRTACWNSVPARPFCVWEVSDPMPRAYVVDRARHVPGLSAVAAVLDHAFDPRGEIVTDQAGVASAGQPGFQGVVRPATRRSDFVELETTTNGAGFLVLADGYDRGWRASVDGREVPVLRANVVFRAVAVPEGTHRVSFVFRPSGLVWGLALSALGLLTALVFAASGGRARVGGGGNA
jgi:hypothetical protein